jgi:hypothetical protein
MNANCEDALQRLYDYLHTEAEEMKQNGDAADAGRISSLEAGAKALELHSRLAYPGENITREELTAAREEIHKMWSESRALTSALLLVMGDLGIRLEAMK